MASATRGDGVNQNKVDMIASDSSSRPIMATPTTLAKLEDPRSWHARGEVGIRPRYNKPRDSHLALPMAPPLPKGRAVPARKKVLEEDDYVERLGDIIESDYFPHNARMSRALSSLGGGAARSTPSTASAGGYIGTPSSSRFSTPGGSSPGRGGPAETQLSTGSAGGLGGKGGEGGALTKFVATHTSEDNQAFAELQEKDQEAFRRRYFWAYDTADGEGNNAKSTKLLIMPNGEMMSVERRALMDAACADKPKIGDDRPNQVETWKHRTRNQLMFSPNLTASNDTCRIEQDPVPSDALLIEGGGAPPKARRKQLLITQSVDAHTRTPGHDTTGTDVALSSSGTAVGPEQQLPMLFSGPASSVLDVAEEEDNASSVSDVAEEEDNERREGGEEVFIDTLSGTYNSRTAEPSSPPQEREKGTALAGENVVAPASPRRAVVAKTNPKVIQAHATRFPVPKARPKRGPWASPIESPSSSRESVAEMLAGGADREEYSEVPMTPSKVPGLDGDSPQITWGSIDGTPMILDPRATPLPDGSLPGVMAAVDIANVAATLGGTGSRGIQFEMKDLPDRDKLAHRLEADDTRRKRAKLALGGEGTGKPLGTPGLTTPLTPRTPGAGRTPGTGRRRDTRGVPSSPIPSTLTPAGRTLAAKLVQRRGMDTPFGGALTPGPQKKRHRSKRGTGDSSKGEVLTPLPGSTPTSMRRGRAGSTTPVGTSGRLRVGAGGDKTQSSLTDGLLAMK